MTADRVRHLAAGRRGFSLIELMIAVMILGLGMVMVATVFPVSLDMTRETLQMHIANATVDAAVETLKLKVPTFENLETVDTGTYDKVRFPNVLVTDLDQDQLLRRPIEDDAVIGDDPAELTLYNDLNLTNGPLPGGAWTAVPPPAWLEYSTTYTEASFWDAEIALQAGANIDLVRSNTWVVQSQNIAVDTKQVVPDLPPFIDLGGVQAPPRVQLLDRVYPPLALYCDYTNYAKVTYDEWDKDNPGGKTQVPAGEVKRRATEQRYAWHAIHTLSSLYQGSGSLLCTIVVTHRGDLNARYAHQGDPVDGDFKFDLTNSTDAQALRTPVTAGAAYDMVFPQAWLVALDGIAPGAGTVACTPVVARMLPVGSFFIIASADPTIASPGFEAGTPHKVLGNNYEPGMTATVTLQIARSAGAVMGATPVWVFPPPIRSHSGPWFEARSPVVGTFIREVTP